MKDTLEGRSACVVVLGDIGRSPRMCNHATSLAEEGVRVRLIGYPGSNPPAGVLSNDKITLKHLTPFSKSLERSLPRLLVYVLKVIWQSVNLLLALPFLFNLPDFLLMQNPPSIPAMFVCYLYCKCLNLGRTKFLVDWHNYGYSILALTLSPSHFLVKLSRKIEAFFGPKADAAFCVTEAMKTDLAQNWGVGSPVTLYDRAPSHFRPISGKEKHDLMVKLGEKYPALTTAEGPSAFTEEFANGRVEDREDRPAILISSTSWTPDEDFSVLLNALEAYETACREGTSRLPDLVCVITGKGPEKAYYSRLIEEKKWRYVTVVMPWLEAEDYPTMLASADLGVCLHTSSSGLDLPMKVVDMFGVGLPVCALNFPALPELVQHGKNGLVFEDSEELARHIIKWFEGFPEGGERRRREFVENIKSFQAVRWGPYWRQRVVPLLEDLLK